MNNLLTISNLFKKLILRELLIYWRKPTLYLQPLLFFVFIIISFPLMLNEGTVKLSILAAPIAWFATLFAIMLSLDTLWKNEDDDGSLYYLFLSGVSLTLISYIKTLCHWLVISLPILILMPLILLLYQISFTKLFIYILTFALGTLSASLIGSMIASLLMRARHASLLLPTILLPLFLPLTILVNAALYANAPINLTSSILLLLSAFFIFTFTLCPLVSAYLLRTMAL